MYYRIFVLSLLFTILPINADTLKVSTAHWPGFTNPDGSGIYFELLDRIYGKENLDLKVTTFNRAVDQFNGNKSDMVLGVYREDVQRAIFPQWLLDTESPIKAFYDSANVNLDSLTKMETLSLSWVRGYRFDRFLPKGKPPYLVNNYKDGFKLLENKKIDAFIDYPKNMPTSGSVNLSSFEVLPARPIYVAFSKTEKGKALANQFDRAMQTLRKSGELKRIFKAFYPRSRLAMVDPNVEKISLLTTDLQLLHEHSGKALESIESKVLDLVTDKLETFGVEYSLMSDYSNMIWNFKDSDRTCVNNVVKTKEREKYFIFSKPLIFYMGIRLYSKFPLTDPVDNSHMENDQPLDILQLLKNDPYKKFGTVKSQKYNDELLSQLVNLPKRQLVGLPTDTTNALKMLENNEFEYLLEYPGVIASYWPLVSNHPLFSYEVSGAEPYTVGYIMCAKTETNQKFINAIDAVIDELYPSSIFRSVHKNMIQANDVTFDKYFQQAFSLSNK